MVIMMDNNNNNNYNCYNCDNNSTDRYFDSDNDIEKGELNFGSESSDTKMGELHSESDKDDEFLSDNVLMKHDDRKILLGGLSNDDDMETVRLDVVTKKVEGGNGGGFERSVVKEKAVAMSAKKPPKPPRPPRGLSLDSADQKLIRELHELARLKRARVERMKALKKAKETKAASSKNQLFATLLTVLFCLVIFLQGISSRANTASSVQGPTFSSELVEQRNIMFSQHQPVSSSAIDHSSPGFQSPRLVEQVYGVDSTGQASRAVG